MTRGEAEAKAAAVIHAAFRALKAGEHDAAEKAAQTIVAITWRPRSREAMNPAPEQYDDLGLPSPGNSPEQNLHDKLKESEG